MQLSSSVRRSDHVSNIITIKFQPTIQVYKTPTNISNKKKTIIMAKRIVGTIIQAYFIFVP